MGTTVSANHEWIELYNSGPDDANLSGWSLSAADGTPHFLFSDGCVNAIIPSGGFFLLERTSDESLPGISADCFYTGALGNAGEFLTLLDALESAVDSVDAREGWPAGDNTTKETMQRVSTGWATAAPTPKTAYIAAPPEAGTIPVIDQTRTEENPTYSLSSLNQQTSPATQVAPSAPEFTAVISAPTYGIAGADIAFRAEAYGAGGRELASAVYLWTFGDGTFARGKNAVHAYRFPGTYVVLLAVSSGEESITKKAVLQVEKNHVAISEIMPGQDGWIELTNAGDRTIDLSRWGIAFQENGLRLPERTFWFPEGTHMLARISLALSADTLGFSFPYMAGVVELLYPNAASAGQFYYRGVLATGESFQKQEDGEVINAPATPAVKNAKAVVARTVSQSAAALTAPATSLSGSNPQRAVVGAPEPPANRLRIGADAQTPALFSSANDTQTQSAEQTSTGTSSLRVSETASAPLQDVQNNKEFRSLWWFIFVLVFGITAGFGVVALRKKGNGIE